MQATSVIDLPPGTHIGERYKLLKAIGQGGFGITYVAWDEVERCQVAVKECFPQDICVRDSSSGMVVPARDSFEPRYMKALEDMRREVRTLAGLDHDAIIRIRDVVWGNGSVFCVMPWLPGGTLRDAIGTRRESISPQQSIEWLHLLLEALRYMHGRSITHRDIKPANIMFDAQQRPVIIDFGAALNRAERTSNTTTSQGAFSRNYAAPEQITGKGRVGPWTDFYSLSATWYELITGIPPEAADARLAQDDMKTLAKQASRLGYPVEMLALLDCNMALQAKWRCQSVEQWEQCWADGTLPTLVHPMQRRWMLILVLAAVLIAVALGIVCAVYFSKNDENFQAIPTVQLPPQNLKQKLEEYVQREIRSQDFSKLCEDYGTKLAQIRERHHREIEQFVARYVALIDRVENEKSGNGISAALHDEYSKISARFGKETAALNADYMKARREFCFSAEDIQKHVQPRNRAEEIMMPAVCGEISIRLSQLDAKLLAFMGAMPDRQQLDEEYLKLEKRMEEKLASVR